ncbi:MAG TPA: hypothetical protein VFY28_01905 [Candidatus Paceibacterota bacterium]|nr:hypothetical protein [Candidatus Paceibacterota bacterium]
MTRRAPKRTEPAPRPRSRKTPPKRPIERSGTLKQRRRQERKLALAVWALATLLFLGAALYGVWLPVFRVNAVEAEGPDPEGIAAAAEEALEGRRFLVLPKDSILLIPEQDIRESVLAAYPAVQAVSIAATGLTSLKVTAIVRASSFTWCGESVEVPAASCYEADAEGLVFAPTERPEAEATTTEPAATSTLASLFGKRAEPSTESSLLVYGPLEGDENGPIRAHVTYASALPGALKFVKGMRALGADIRSVTLRGDEIDLHTRAGTRITYVIGKEGQAAVLASTAFPTLDLNDDSIEYVDLRFENKVYLKRTDEQ